MIVGKFWQKYEKNLILSKFFYNFAKNFSFSAMTNKEIYRRLCEQTELPLFMQYWWLEGVCAGKDWDVLIVKQPLPSSEEGKKETASPQGEEIAENPIPQEGEGNDESSEVKASELVLAAMPYEINKRFWLRHVNQPVLTPYGGIWFNPSVADNADKVAELYQNLSEQLSALKLVSYNQLYRPDCPSVHLLDELRFKFVTRRTYILSDLSDLQHVINGFSRSKRKKLEKDTLTYSISELEAEEFFYFHQQTMAQKKEKPTYTRENLLVIAEKAAARKQIRIFGVRNQDSELLAAAVVVWDKKYAYLLLDTFDHDLPDCGARELLTLEAIKQARSLGLKFDFARHRSYLKSYGAKKTTFYSVHKGAAPYVMLQRFIEWSKH